jgi:acetyl-CoA carboxylase alpha subunit
MIENSVYSVISPEGCASILWKDSAKVKEAAQCLKITAEDLYGLGVIEKIIEEPNHDFNEVYENLKDELYHTIIKNKALDTDVLLQNRYDRFRKIGVNKL